MMLSTAPLRRAGNLRPAAGRALFHASGWPALLLAASVLAFCFSAPAQDPAPAKDWKRSLITIDVKRKRYDYFQPWTRPLENFQKFGLVAGPGEILTTAEGLADSTLVRAQKNGRGTWFLGAIKWIDYHANLAMLTVADDHFWEGLEPAGFGKTASSGTAMSVLRWKTGKIEQFRGEFKQYALEESRLSFASYAQLELTCEIDTAGGAEPVVSGDQVIGLVSMHVGHDCRVLPAAFLRRMIEARAKNGFPGFGYFDFVWEPGQNPTTLKFFGARDPDHGVVVIDVPDRPESKVVKPRDVILQVEGFDIDSTGDYNDPDYGFLSLENLATRDKWAGDETRLTLLRDGAKLQVSYRLPKVEYSAKLVPEHIFDRPPEYMIVGGLVFEPLTGPYLHSWGADWKRRAPFRLNYYTFEPPAKDRPSLVLLSQVLPDPYNLGYQEDRFSVLNRVNGVKVSTLQEIQAALQHPENGFHVLEFMEGERVLKAVLDAGTADEATRRILKRYGIEKDHLFAE